MRVPVDGTLRRSLGQGIVQELLGWLRDGHVRAGERFPTERELMERFSVGRNTVREAIQSLVAIGIVEVRPGRGTVVLNAGAERALDPVTVSALLDGQTIEDLYSFRLLLEAEIAALAAVRATEDDLREIELELLRCRRAFEQGAATYEADVEYHRSIAKASENVIYMRVLDAIGDLLMASRRSTDALPAARAAAMVGHTEIFDAICSRDPEAAREAMKRHIVAATEAMHEAQRAR